MDRMRIEELFELLKTASEWDKKIEDPLEGLARNLESRLEQSSFFTDFTQYNAVDTLTNIMGVRDPRIRHANILVFLYEELLKHLSTLRTDDEIPVFSIAQFGLLRRSVFVFVITAIYPHLDPGFLHSFSSALRTWRTMNADKTARRHQLNKACDVLLRLCKVDVRVHETVTSEALHDIITANEQLMHLGDKSLKDRYEEFLDSVHSPRLKGLLLAVVKTIGNAPAWFKNSLNSRLSLMLGKEKGLHNLLCAFIEISDGGGTVSAVFRSAPFAESVAHLLFTVPKSSMYNPSEYYTNITRQLLDLLADVTWWKQPDCHKTVVSIFNFFVSKLETKAGALGERVVLDPLFLPWETLLLHVGQNVIVRWSSELDKTLRILCGLFYPNVEIASLLRDSLRLHKLIPFFIQFLGTTTMISLVVPDDRVAVKAELQQLIHHLRSICELFVEALPKEATHYLLHFMTNIDDLADVDIELETSELLVQELNSNENKDVDAAFSLLPLLFSRRLGWSTRERMLNRVDCVFAAFFVRSSKRSQNVVQQPPEFGGLNQRTEVTTRASSLVVMRVMGAVAKRWKEINENLDNGDLGDVHAVRFVDLDRKKEGHPDDIQVEAVALEAIVENFLKHFEDVEMNFEDDLAVMGLMNAVEAMLSMKRLDVLKRSQLDVVSVSEVESAWKGIPGIAQGASLLVGLLQQPSDQLKQAMRDLAEEALKLKTTLSDALARLEHTNRAAALNTALAAVDELLQSFDDELVAKHAGPTAPITAKSEVDEMEQLKDGLSHPLEPMRGHALLHAARLVRERRAHFSPPPDWLFETALKLLHDPDSYVYLAAINCLAEMAVVDDDLLYKLVDLFINWENAPRDSRSDVENDEGKERLSQTRAKLAEAISRVFKFQGEMSFNCADHVLEALFSCLDSRDEVTRASVCSALANLVRASHGILRHLEQILACAVQRLESDPSVLVQRTAIHLIRETIVACDDNLLGTLCENLRDVFRVLLTYRENATDSVVRLHAQCAIDDINAALKKNIERSQPRIFNI